VDLQIENADVISAHLHHNIRIPVGIAGRDKGKRIKARDWEEEVIGKMGSEKAAIIALSKNAVGWTPEDPQIRFISKAASRYIWHLIEYQHKIQNLYV
jgi:hypothetical protein